MVAPRDLGQDLASYSRFDSYPQWCGETPVGDEEGRLPVQARIGN
jgi:hypothetical protein